MNDMLIENYINKLTIEDIKKIAKKENIIIDDKECQIILECLSNHWRALLYGNPKEVLQMLKLKLNNDTYNKIEKLYTQYKSRIG